MIGQRPPPKQVPTGYGAAKGSCGGSGTFDEGYTAAQVFAPGDDDVVCFEPMAAPTDSLRRGGYRVVNAGEFAVAQFRIKVI